MKGGFILALLVFTLAISGCSPELSPTPTAYFKFGEYSSEGHQISEDTFIVKLTNPTAISQARTAIADDEYLHVMGEVQHSQIDYNPPWNFHLNPVNLFTNAMEVCDSTIAMVNSGSVEFCGSEDPCYFCPWTSKLIAEVYCRDQDGDGFYDETSLSCPGTDCNDGNAAINPDATEICGNLVDENCDNIRAKCFRTDKYLMRP